MADKPYELDKDSGSVIPVSQVENEAGDDSVTVKGRGNASFVELMENGSYALLGEKLQSLNDKIDALTDADGNFKVSENGSITKDPLRQDITVTAGSTATATTIDALGKKVGVCAKEASASSHNFRLSFRQTFSLVGVVNDVTIEEVTSNFARGSKELIGDKYAITIVNLDTVDHDYNIQTTEYA